MTSFRKLCLEAELSQEKIELLVPFLVKTYEDPNEFLDEVAVGGPNDDSGESPWPEGLA